MRKTKLTLYIIVPLAVILFVTKWVLFDYVVSSGKRVGNLTKLSKKGKLLKTWEGTLDEGSGDKLTSYFSVRSEVVAQELFGHEGRKVIIFYHEHLVAWPYDTKYNVVDWKAFDEGNMNEVKAQITVDEQLLNKLQESYFCSMLGTLYSNSDLYIKVKEHMKANNPFIYKQYEKCND